MDFCRHIILNITGSYYILEELTSSDEATSHIRGKFNGSRWEREKPQDVWQHERDFPKLNMWCALMKSRIIGPFFLKEATVNSELYPALLQGFLIPELRQLSLLRPNLLSVRRCPYHCASNVRRLLNDVFPEQWLGTAGPTAWPPPSPFLTTFDYLL
jgi:hypothetical protein